VPFLIIFRRQSLQRTFHNANCEIRGSLERESLQANRRYRRVERQTFEKLELRRADGLEEKLGTYGLSRRVMDGAVACYGTVRAVRSIRALGPASPTSAEAGSPFSINIGGRNEMIRTGIYVKEGNKTFYLDDAKEGQRYTKYMTLKQKERFAKSYVRYVLEAKEQELWFKRMAK
jgi:hypothetical protein